MLSVNPRFIRLDWDVTRSMKRDTRSGKEPCMPFSLPLSPFSCLNLFNFLAHFFSFTLAPLFVFLHSFISWKNIAGIPAGILQRYSISVSVSAANRQGEGWGYTGDPRHCLSMINPQLCVQVGRRIRRTGAPRSPMKTEWKLLFTFFSFFVTEQSSVHAQVNSSPFQQDL